MKRVHVWFYGEVQGVGFRNFVSRGGVAAGLTGTVRNCVDGSVEAELEGEEPLLRAFLREVREQGPGQIRSVREEWSESTGEFSEMKVIK